MKHCEHLPEMSSDDYALQIQGDDIVLHTKKPISSEQRKKICE
jgi:hypothetical protein